MSPPSSPRLPKALTGPYRYLRKNWRWVRWVGRALLAAALVVGGSLLYRTTRPLVYSSGDLMNMAWSEGRKRLEDAEARSQLVLIGDRIAAQNVSEEVQLLTNAVIAALTRAYTGPLPPERDWTVLEPLLDRLAVQVASGDPLAQETITELIALLSAPVTAPGGS